VLISAFFQFLRVNQVSLQRLWMDATTSPGPARVTPEARPLILNDDGDSVSSSFVALSVVKVWQFILIHMYMVCFSGFESQPASDRTFLDYPAWRASMEKPLNTQ